MQCGTGSVAQASRLCIHRRDGGATEWTFPQVNIEPRHRYDRYETPVAVARLSPFGKIIDRFRPNIGFVS